MDQMDERYCPSWNSIPSPTHSPAGVISGARPSRNIGQVQSVTYPSGRRMGARWADFGGEPNHGRFWRIAN